MDNMVFKNEILVKLRAMNEKKTAFTENVNITYLYPQITLSLK